MTTSRSNRDALLYNLLPGERERIRAYQHNLDPITGQPLKSYANLDHDHKTGLIRGLLNPLTNKMLNDNPEYHRRCIEYLEKPPAVEAIGVVHGLMGQAKRKKVMRYGPAGSPHRQPRRDGTLEVRKLRTSNK